MPKQHPLGDEDDDLLLDDEDVQQEEVEQGDEPEEPEQPAEDEQEEPEVDPFDEEPEAPRVSKKADRDRRERAKQRAIKQRQALHEARRLAAQRESEAAALRARIAELESGGIDAEIFRLDHDLEIYETQLTAAIENGDAVATAKAHRKIAQLEAEKANATRAKASAPKQDAAKLQVQDTVPGAIPRELRAWSARHGGVMAWNQEERELLAEVATEIRDEGEYESAEFLEELERRLKPLLPHRINSALPQRQPRDLRVPPRAAPSPATNGRVAAQTSGPNRQLTQSERSLMRAMGRDPANKAHVAAFIAANPKPVGVRRVER